MILLFGTYTAQVAEVTVDARGEVRLDRVVCAVDCGRVVNPDGAKAQIEGGIIFGASAALYNAIDIENGRIVQPTSTLIGSCGSTRPLGSRSIS